MRDLKTPVLCIQCWKLAHHLQLESLKNVSISSLGQHLDAMALLAFNNRHWVLDDDGQHVGMDYGEPKPKWLTCLLDAFREVCVDEVTRPLRATFVAFLWVSRFELLELPDVMDILSQNDDLNEGLYKLMLWGDFLHPRELPAWLSFGGAGDVVREIKQRDYAGFPDEGYFAAHRCFCSECDVEITGDDFLYHNPFPVEGAEIGQLTWCHGCVATFNEQRCWPWRSRDGRRPGDAINLEAWHW